MEVQAINVLAPFILNSKLKPLLLKAGRDTYIVNVSAMEGQFYRYSLRSLQQSHLHALITLTQEAQDASPSAYKYGQGCAQHDDTNFCPGLRYGKNLHEQR